MGFISGGSSDAPARILAKLITVDGAGSGLDSDFVDAAHAIAFATAAQGIKADNALPSATYTANDILAKLITVDGSGSGLDADLLDGLNTSSASTVSTIAARDASGNLTANVLVSDVITGTAPLTVTSTTKVDNLNADLFDDMDTSIGSTPSTIASRDASGDLTANVLRSDVADGTAPLTVESTTKVDNLNADRLDDMNTATASTASTIVARDASGNLTGNVLVSDVITGTAPLTVSSTTRVDNLNADLFDDMDTSIGSTPSTIVARDSSGDITGNVLVSDVSTGTAPLTVESTTKVDNLNVDLLDGLNTSSTSTVSTIVARDASANITGNVLVSDVITGTAPLTVASTTRVDNLNADLFDDMNTSIVSTPTTIVARDVEGNITGNVIKSDVSTGTSPLTVESTTKVDNLNADLLDDMNTATASTVSTITARDASGNITGNVLVSDVADGTPPLTVTSTTRVDNLNADLFDDMNTSIDSTPTTIVARDVEGNITGNVIKSDVATGTPPLTVESTTKVDNLNADLLDDLNSATGSAVSTIVARDASGNVTAKELISDIVTGTAPLTVASITKVDNLNADLLDGLDTSIGSTPSTIVERDVLGNITGNVLVSDVADGIAPLTIESTTKVTNLNADRLDDAHASATSTASTIVLRDASGNTTSNVVKSDVATGTAPLTVSSTTRVTNLNADLLDDMDTSIVSTPSTIVIRDTSGDITGNVLVSDVATGTAPLIVESTTKVDNLTANTTDSVNISAVAESTVNGNILINEAEVNVYTVINPSTRKFIVTTAFDANEVITLSTGAGASSGASTASGDTVTLNASSAAMIADNTCRVRLTGVTQTKGTDFVWNSTLTGHFLLAMDIGDKFEIERIGT